MANQTVKIRGGFRARATTLINKWEADDSITDFKTLTKIKEEISRLKDTLLDYDTKILESFDETTSDQRICDEITANSEFTMKISSCIQDINSKLDTLSPNLEQRPKVYNNVKMPNLNLIKFSGDLLEWPQFWDLYRTTVHVRTDFGAPSKFGFLRGQLEGDAADLLSGFKNTEQDYAQAITLLEETYGKPHLLKQARLHALLDLTTPAPTSADLSRFRAQYEGHIRGLQGLDANIHEAGYVFAAILMRKLPPKIADNINRTAKSKEWELEDLRKAIDMEVEHLRASEAKHEDVHSNLVKNVSTMSNAIHTNSEYNSNKIIIKTCPFCSDNHISFNCTKYSNANTRRNRVKELKLCTNCLKPNHIVSQCNNNFNCKVCNKRHHTSLHDPNFQSEHRRGKNFNDKKSNANSSTSTVTISNNNVTTTNILPTANLNLVSEKGNASCKALFDTGAQKSFCLKSLAHSMKLPVVNSIELSIDGFNSGKPPAKYDIVECRVKSEPDIIFTAVVVEKLPLHITMLGRAKAVKSLLEQNVKLADSDCKDVCSNLQLIVGIDSIFKFMYGQPVGEELYVIPSRVGNLLAGNIPAPTINASMNSITVLHVAAGARLDMENCCSATDKMIKNMWELDNIGIKNPNDFKDDPTLAYFESTIQYKNNRYTASLPWKDGHPPLPSNYNMAWKRMISVLEKLRKNPNDLELYNKIILDQLERGFIESVNDDDVTSGVHYLAHHAIYKNSATTPLRIVFDCSSNVKGSPSLNDCLYSGPCLMNELASILLRFRLGKFACAADISKAFLQVGLNDCDRDFTRFLWPENPTTEGSRIHTYRFKVVLFGATCSQFLLNATLMHHLKSLKCRTSDELLRNIYVDNVQNSFHTEKNAIEFYENSRKLLSEAGFPLEQWSTNSPKLIDKINEFKGVTKNESSNVSILGIYWDTKFDKFQLSNVQLEDRSTVTKRTVTSDISKIYDPLGFLLPVTIRSRDLIQKLWKAKLSWDEVLTEDLLQEWYDLRNDLNQLSNITIDRNIYSSNTGVLHVFADSSKTAYGAVAYLLTGNHSNLIMAKARIAPLKPVKLPQLELTAINIAARLACFIKSSYDREIQISSVHIWSDSTIALSWLSAGICKKPYVQQRVNEISSLVPDAKFHHVSGLENPADLLTRGIKFKKFNGNSLWFTGPPWLSSFTDDNSSFVACIPTREEKTSSDEETSSESFPEIFDVKKFSSFSKCVRIMSYVFKFINKIKGKIHRESNDDDTLRSMTSLEEEKTAEKFLISQCQKEFYKDVVSYLECSKNSKLPAIINQLGLCIYDGIIRCKGRLSNSDLNYDSKYPVLLPPAAHLTKLLVRKIHEEKFHSGLSDTLSFMRTKFWVPRARQVIKGMLSKCVVCRKIRGKAFGPKETAQLPVERVRESRPFQVTGLDYTGALNVRNGSVIVKVYIVIFSCAVTRALHCELVENCSEEEFLAAFMRFVSRRSFPQLIISDNAKTFISAAKTLKSIANHPNVINYFNRNKMEWKFITCRAPWVGGFYERMVGLTKTCLKSVIGKSLINVNLLRTLLVRIESKLNDRPITFVYDNHNEVQPLTPSQLIYGYRLDSFPDHVDNSELLDPTFGERQLLSDKLTKLTVILQKFWQRWSNEYLVALREKHNNKKDHSCNQKIQLGQVVLIHEDTPRINWRLGLIVELLHSSDGIVRSVNVKTSSGVLNRPITKLYPLEVTSENCVSETNSSETNSELEHPRVEKLPRVASLKAREKIRNIAEN